MSAPMISLFKHHLYHIDEHAFFHYQAIIDIIAQNDAEKRENKVKKGQPEQEIKSSSKKITSFEENLKRIIAAKNKVISHLQREKSNPEVMKCRKDEIHEVHSDKRNTTLM